MILEIETIEGQHFTTHSRLDKVVLGRGKDAHCRILIEDISRAHCEIRREGSKYFVKDLNSHNGTYLGDEKLIPNVEREFISVIPLKLGAKVTIHVHDDDFVLNKESKYTSVANTQEDLTTTIRAQDMEHHKIRMQGGGASGLKPLAKKKEKSANNKLPITIAFLMAGLAYYYYDTHKIEEAPVLFTTEAAVKEVNVKAAPPAIKTSLANAFLKQYPKTGCESGSEKLVCNALGLKEGAYVAKFSNELVLMIDLETFLHDNAELFSQVTETRKLRYAAIYLMDKMIKSWTQDQHSPVFTMGVLGTNKDRTKVESTTFFPLNFAGEAKGYSEALKDAIQTGKIDNFEKRFGKFFQTTDFTK